MSDHSLTQAEKRCLLLSFEICKRMPDYPECIRASFGVSRHATIESLNTKGFLRWSAHRGSSYYFTEKARLFVGAPPLSPPTGTDSEALSTGEMVHRTSESASAPIGQDEAEKDAPSTFPHERKST